MTSPYREIISHCSIRFASSDAPSGESPRGVLGQDRTAQFAFLAYSVCWQVL